MPRAVIWWCLLGALACSRTLPSSAPLGSGPRAEPEPEERTLAVGLRSSETVPPTRAPAAAKTQVADGEESTAGGAGGSAASAEPEKKPDQKPEGESTQILAGRYSGEDLTVTRLPGRPEDRAEDPNAITDVELLAAGRIKITILDSSTGNPYCALVGDVKERKVTIDADQSCFDSNDVVFGTVTEGSATFDERSLELDLTGSISYEQPTETVEGTFEYHFEGTLED